MLLDDALGKPVADALTLLLIVTDRPAFLPLLIHPPALLQGGGIDGMFGGKDQVPPGTSACCRVAKSGAMSGK